MRPLATFPAAPAPKAITSVMNMFLYGDRNDAFPTGSRQAPGTLQGPSRPQQAPTGPPNSLEQEAIQLHFAKGLTCAATARTQGLGSCKLEAKLHRQMVDEWLKHST